MTWVPRLFRLRKASGQFELLALQRSCAEFLEIDLIVMATHGRKGVRRLVLGSVAERVIREAPCAVLTVKPKAARSGASQRQSRP